jgi:hypothetical protein
VAKGILENIFTVDKSIFGSTSKTYTIRGTWTFGEDAWSSLVFPVPDLPKIEASKTKVSEGIHHPSAFGLDVKIPKLSVGKCILDREWNLWMGYAHAHPDSACFSRPDIVIEEIGKPHYILLHEYAHVLAGLDAWHGPQWVAEMEKLGLGDRAYEHAELIDPRPES